MLRDLLTDRNIRYLRATYYFGDAAPYTCWDGFRADLVDIYLDKIQMDGFNCVIFLIPASISKLEAISPKTSDFFWSSLTFLLERTQAHGLFVLFRLNYIWDRFPVALDRFTLSFQFQVSGEEKARLYDFLGRLYDFAISYDHFLYGFITWEDATLYLIDHAPRLAATDRVSIARSLGYSTPFGSDLGLEQQIVPPLTHHMFRHYLEFVDERLVHFYQAIRAVFPRLSMEVRCDVFPVKNQDGATLYHVHLNTYQTQDMDIVGTYFGIYMEAINQHEQLSARTAFENFARVQYRVLSCSSHLKRSLVFVDQFLFCIRENAFSHFAWLDEADHAEFIELCAEWMRDHSVGYAAWSFQDYLSDQISNGTFATELDGWEHSGPVDCEPAESGRCVLREGGAVWQLLPEKLFRGYILIEAYALEDAEIEVRRSEDPQAGDTICVDSQHKLREIRPFEGETYFLSVKALRGSIRLLKLSIGAEVASHGAYSIDFAETTTTRALIKLNAALAKFAGEQGIIVPDALGGASE
jgi:hypothetical protein